MQTTFCSFLSLPSLYDYGVKMPNFTEDVDMQQRICFLSDLGYGS